MNAVVFCKVVCILPGDIPRQKKNSHVLPILPRPLNELTAADTRHVQITNENVVVLGFQELDRGSAIVEAIGLIAAGLENTLDELRDVRLIIDNQYGTIGGEGQMVVRW